MILNAAYHRFSERVKTYHYLSRIQVSLKQSLYSNCQERCPIRLTKPFSDRGKRRHVTRNGFSHNPFIFVAINGTIDQAFSRSTPSGIFTMAWVRLIAHRRRLMFNGVRCNSVSCRDSVQ